MKKYLLIGMIMVWFLASMAGFAMANPWIVCDPQPGIDGYTYSLDGGIWRDTPYEEVTKGGVLCAVVMDLAAVSVGNHTITVKSFVVDLIWGRLESIPVPFAFTRPGSGPSLDEPSGFRVITLP